MFLNEERIRFENRDGLTKGVEPQVNLSVATRVTTYTYGFHTQSTKLKFLIFTFIDLRSEFNMYLHSKRS